MAGIINKTARQFNLKCVDKNKNRVTVRVAPGFNVVDDDHWAPMKNDPYVKSLKKKGDIDFGKAVDDMELEQAPDTKAKSKSTPAPQLSKEDKAEEEKKGLMDKVLDKLGGGEDKSDDKKDDDL